MIRIAILVLLLAASAHAECVYDAGKGRWYDGSRPAEPFGPCDSVTQYVKYTWDEKEKWHRVTWDTPVLPDSDLCPHTPNGRVTMIAEKSLISGAFNIVYEAGDHCDE